MDAEQVDDNQAQEELPEQLARRGATVLANLRPLLHHDVPNHLLALQGLLQMLRLEERDRLSPEGKEYLERLLTLSERLQQVLIGIRSISKLLWERGVPELIPLGDLVPEVAAIVKQAFPAQLLPYHETVREVQVQAVRRHLASLLVELIRLLVQPTEKPLVLYLFSRLQEATVELLLWGRPAAGTSEPVLLPRMHFKQGPGELDLDLLGPEQRLSLLLAQELACACGGNLTAQREDSGGPVFRLLLPGKECGQG